MPRLTAAIRDPCDRDSRSLPPPAIRHFAIPAPLVSSVVAPLTSTARRAISKAFTIAYAATTHHSIAPLIPIAPAIVAPIELVGRALLAPIALGARSTAATVATTARAAGAPQAATARGA